MSISMDEQTFTHTEQNAPPEPPILSNGDLQDAQATMDHAHSAQHPEDHLSAYDLDPTLRLQVQEAEEVAQQIAQSHMDLSQSQYQTLAAALDGSASPSQVTNAASAAAAAALRMKTTRACDQCRRKKVRCDGTTDMTGACTACKRTMTECTYARTPQKRGPNRGYIQKLTQKVELLERQRQGQSRETSSPSADDVNAVPGSDAALFSLANGGDHGEVQRAEPTSLKRDADEELEIALRADRNGVPPETRNETNATATHSQSTRWNGYFQNIHPYLPFLSANAEDFEKRQEPSTSFSVSRALDTLLPIFTDRKTNQTSTVPLLSSVLDTWRGSKMDSDPTTNDCCTSLMMQIASTYRGSATVANEAIDPWSLMQQVMSAMEAGNLIVQQPYDSHTSANDRRQIEITACMLDVLMSCANSDYPMGSLRHSSAVAPLAEDCKLFGERNFQMNRIMDVLRTVKSSPIVDDSDQPNGIHNQHADQISAQDLPQLRRLKICTQKMLQCVQLTFNYASDPIVAMTFWYAYLIIEIHYYPIANPSMMLSATSKLLDSLNSLSIFNILTPHFAGLAAHLLTQLCDFNDTRKEAKPLLDQLDDILNRIVPDDEADSFDEAIRHTVMRKRMSLRRDPSGLEQLASVAVGGEDDGDVLNSIAEAAAAAAQAAMGHGQAMNVDAPPFSGEQLRRGGYLADLL